MSIKLLTVLGTGNYVKTDYSYEIGGKKINTATEYVQEAVYNIIEEIEGDKEITVDLFLTEQAKERHWEKEDKETLKDIFDNKKIDYKVFDITAGESEKQILENFNTIFDSLEDGDEVYIDITHSFRSIPVILLSILEYSKSVKDVKLKGLFYGSFNQDTKEGNIIDLSVYNDLSTWSYEIQKFMETGNASGISNEMDQELKVLFEEIDKDTKALMGKVSKINGKMKEFSESLLACRSDSLLKSANEIKRALESLDSEKLSADTDNFKLYMFLNLYQELNDMFSGFNGELVNDINEAVKICIDKKMIQQAATFLNENIINFVFTKIYETREGKPFKGNILKYLDEREEAEEWMKNRRKLEDISVDKEFETELKEFRRIEAAGLRNDLNHAGYNGGPAKFENMSKNLEEYVRIFESFIEKSEGKFRPYEEKEEVERKMFLVFSHNMTSNQIESAKEELGIKEFVYLPDELQKKWSEIPIDETDMSSYVSEIFDYLTNEASVSEDYILVQGDMGATYNLVYKLKSCGYKVVYSKTKRKVTEEERGNETVSMRVFKHEGFREY